MMLRTFLLFAVTFAGIGATSQGASTHRTTDRIDTRVLGAASVSLKHSSPARVVRWLTRQRAVRTAEVGPDNRSVDILFRDGTHGIILPSALQTVKVDTSGFRPLIRTLAPARAPQGRALVLEPFATELGLGPNAGDVEVGALQKAGFQVDQLYDTNVTVNVSRTLANYNVVYMHTHSDAIAGGNAVVATGQVYSGDPSLAPLEQAGELYKTGVSGTNVAYYGFTANFVQHYEGQFPANSLLFLNGCKMLPATMFWQALQQKGLGVMVSWDDEATSQDNYLSGAAFFSEMDQGLSVFDALQAEKQAGFGKSSFQGKQTQLGFLGDGTITLAKAASSPVSGTPGPNGPTSTPVAKATGTRVLATSTPIATATPASTETPVPGPPLTFSMKRHVAPGASQIVEIHSNPETIIHILITFPNGDTRSATTATDGRGVARFTFIQHPSKITPSSVTATVTVDATKGSAVTKISQKYRIDWGRIDADVEPRQQAVDGWVAVSVHTESRTRVTTVMHFPAGVTKTILRRTGAHGWIHIHYKIGHYLKKPNSHMVLVQSEVKIHGKIYRAETMYKIL